MKETISEWIVALVFIGSAWWYAGHHAVEEYKQEVAAEQAKADAAQQAKYNKLAGDYEALKTTRQSNANTITRTYEKIIEKPVYSTVCIEPSGLLLANEAIAGKPATKLNDKMPSNQTP